MLCPKCSMRTLVINSRREEKAIIRTRKCLGCGYRFKTDECFFCEVRKMKGGVPLEER